VAACLAASVERRVYRLRQLGREGRQHLDELSCVLDRMVERLFHEIPLDRRNLFLAMRFAKLFDVLIRTDKRLAGHLRDLANESLDGFDGRGHFSIIDRTIGVGYLRARFSHRSF
jgi:hypothetical protein